MADPRPARRVLDALLRRPVMVLCVSLALLAVALLGLARFRLDASSDSLVLDQDADLRVYDDTRLVFGADSSLVVVVQPRTPLFQQETLAAVEALAVDLEQVEGVESVLAVTRAPLFRSPPVGLFRLADGFRTLRDAGTEIGPARAEILDNPLYREALVSIDERTTALQVTLAEESGLMALEQERYRLRDLRDSGALDPAARRELATVSEAFRAETLAAADRRRALVATLRQVLEEHRDLGTVELGGLPMISVDIIRYVERDMVVFGVASVVFVLAAVFLLLRSVAWTVAITVHCSLTVLALLGILGWLDWRVTVVTSNLSSLLFIMTLAMSMHIAIRAREEASRSAPTAGALTGSPAPAPSQTLAQALDHVLVPCLFTVLTTMVGFGSLYLSRIPPVMDFALMMGVGLGLAFLTCFVLLPSLVMVLVGGTAPPPRPATSLYRRVAEVATTRRRTWISLSVGLAILGVAGISRLTVENSFVDYFRESSQIHRGLTLIDEELGGTTPLEIVLDADRPDAWLGMDALEEVAALHAWLEEQPEIGQVTSLDSLVEILRQIIASDPQPALRNVTVNTFLLQSLRNRIPAEVAASALEPYVSDDYSMTRITARVRESTPGIDRDVLLQRLRRHLQEEPVAAAREAHVTGMFVLYDNMLQSLFSSQVSTLAAVLAAIALMFWLLLRSVRLALLALAPNLLPVCVVLGALGWAGVPLDMMTIMIAAITLGISVDDTVHYLYRYRHERAGGLQRVAAIARSHDTVGRAMLATTVAVTFGFAILLLSNFKPTVTFGALTGLAMVTALLADALLLPALLASTRDEGREGVP